jgi:hypothetical protein
VTHTTRAFDKMGETTQTVVRTSQESARIFTDYTVKAQELNTQFARRAVETWIDGLRKQTELSQDVAQELFGRAEEQADAYRRFFGQWGNFPMGGFPFPGMANSVMFPFQRQGMHLVDTAARSTEETLATATFPIAGYDEKNVDEISARLDALSTEQIRRLRTYEKANKNRQSLIDRFDSKLRVS